ncbi:MAG: pyruvate formate-lyase-activating protein [Firmicutes bacterium]|nr:pyruvate formate-lyase-activating protein [Bacillota bacterium]
MDGRIHSIETGGMVDGPGIRYVIFAQGCPLRCIYCHNPDTWNGNCKRAKTLSADELMSDILKYKSYFKHSNGGITLSGGEPLIQKQFATELFRSCKQNGIHTVLDTSGYDGINDTTKQLLAYTDLVLLDIKSINPETYKKITKQNITKSIEFAKYLSTKNIPTWIRFVLVPDINDNESETHELGQFISSLSNIQKIEVIPFHQMGAHKWKEMEMNYELEYTKEPSKTQIHNARKILKQYNPNIEVV